MSEKNDKQQNEEIISVEAKEELVVNEDVLEIKEEAVQEENQLVHMIDATNLVIDGNKYEMVMNYREGFSIEKLAERYSDILSKYDFIVADWGFDQLRLKGFYEDKNRKVPQDQRIGSLQDYLYEYCNFGCAYFVLKRIGGPKEKSARPKRPRNRSIAAKEANKTNKSKESIASTKNKKQVSTKGNQNSRTKNEHSRSTGKSTKKNFTTKKVQEKTEKVVKAERKSPVETVKEKNGQRHFNIRRNDVEKAKNKE